MDNKYPSEEWVEEKSLNRQLIQSQIKQGDFNELLILATLVLALGFILNFFKIPLDWKNNDFITGILIFVGILFIIFIIVLLVKAIQYLFKISTKIKR